MSFNTTIFSHPSISCILCTMILSDHTLKQLLDSGELIIDPITDSSIQPASIDCRIGSHYLVVDDRENHNGVITFNDELKYRDIESDHMIIPPHSFLLATTMEYIKLPNGITAFEPFFWRNGDICLTSFTSSFCISLPCES